MSYVLETELEKFNANCQALGSGRFKVQKLCEYGFLIEPAVVTLNLPRDKSIGLTLMGITHGNEVVGVAALNAFLELLRRPLVDLQTSIALVLGNPWAAQKNRRFLDRDLNRSFARREHQSLEDKRAKDLEAILKRSAYLLDIHQTRERSDRPFFIFPYTTPGFELAQAVAPYLPIVTHWGDHFSEDGRCSDEFVNSCGGVGITIELGQNGFDPYQVSAGCASILQTVAAVQTQLSGQQLKLPPTKQAEIYTWATVMPYEEGEIALEPGFYNFKHVLPGMKLGTHNGKPLKSQEEGWLLFPQYPKPEDEKRPSELCRIMRRVAFAELPTDV